MTGHPGRAWARGLHARARRRIGARLGPPAGLEPTRAGRERGSATLLTIAVACLALVAAMALAGAAQAHTAGARAQGVADLAALAGASRAVRGGDGCAAAAVVVDRHGARLLDCIPAPGGFLRVRVRVVADLALLGGRPADAGARAGPVR